MNGPSQEALIQTIIGCICALGLVALGYFSLDPTLTLGWPAASAIVVTIAMLLGKLDELTALVSAWMERHGQRPPNDND